MCGMWHVASRCCGISIRALCGSVCGSAAEALRRQHVAPKAPAAASVTTSKQLRQQRRRRRRRLLRAAQRIHLSSSHASLQFATHKCNLALFRRFHYTTKHPNTPRIHSLPPPWRSRELLAACSVMPPSLLPRRAFTSFDFPIIPLPSTWSLSRFEAPMQSIVVCLGWCAAQLLSCSVAQLLSCRCVMSVVRCELCAFCLPIGVTVCPFRACRILRMPCSCLWLANVRLIFSHYYSQAATTTIPTAIILLYVCMYVRQKLLLPSQLHSHLVAIT